MKNLPEKISAGDELEIQIAPLGDYKCHDGTHDIVQRVTPEAVSRLVETFPGEILVDIDHRSEKTDSTEAAAWLQSLRNDPELGLMGTLKFTDAGADAVTNRRYRFVSVAWNVDKSGMPDTISSIALTNKPNLPVRPILNSVAPDAAAADQPKPEATKGNPAMEELKKALGLAPEATDEEVAAAVKALQDRIAALEGEAKNKEAEDFAAQNSDKCDKDVLKNAYLRDPEMAAQIVSNIIKAPAETTRVCNSKTATPPVISKTRGDARAELSTLPPAERPAYYAAHRAEIDNKN